MNINYWQISIFALFSRTDKRSTAATDPVAVQHDASDAKRKGHRSIVKWEQFHRIEI